MTDKPRRPWFQLHLSTAIVIFLVAGLLLGVFIRRDCFGEWPFGERPMSRDTWNLNAAIQVTLSLVTLLFVAIGCEHHIRRREARAP